MTSAPSTPTTAMMRFSSAREMQQGAVLITKHNQATGEQRSIGATYFLMGFALELYLKAFLLRTGMDDKVLSGRKFGHNLRALHIEAVQRGLAFPEADQLALLVECLAEAHADFTFRYMQPDTDIKVPQPIEAALDLLARLDDHLTVAEDIALGKKLLGSV